MAVAGGEVEAVVDVVFGDDGGKGEGGVAGLEDGGDAVGVFAGEEAAEEALGLPASVGAPGGEAGGEFSECGVGLMGDHDVLTETLDPAEGAGGDAMGGGAFGFKGLAQGGGNPMGGLRGGWG